MPDVGAGAMLRAVARGPRDDLPDGQGSGDPPRPRPWLAGLSRLTPAVPRRVLGLIAGLLWAGVGVMLCRLAVLWLLDDVGGHALWLALGGVALALLIHHLGFLKLVGRNVERIRAKADRACAFGFQPLRSYLTILVMVAMGIALRSSPVPKPYLAPVYVGFGGAMALSSVRYLRLFARGLL